MKSSLPCLSVICLFLAAPASGAVAGSTATRPALHWPLDGLTDRALTIRGHVTEIPGVHSQALILDGKSLLEVKHSAALNTEATGFTLVVWAAPFAPGGDQQMIAAKNRNSLNERQWGVMIDRDGKFRLYVEQGGWKTTTATTRMQKGSNFALCNPVDVRLKCRRVVAALGHQPAQSKGAAHVQVLG